MQIKQLFQNKVANASCWYTVTEFFLKGISFLTIPIFTRLLTPQDYGIVSLYTTWVGILTILFGLELGSSITKAKFIFKDDFDNYVNNIIYLSLAAYILFFSIFYMFRVPFSNIMNVNGILYFLMLIQAYFSFIRVVLITKLRVEYKYKLLSLLLIATSIWGEGLSLYLILHAFKKQAYVGKILGSAIPIILMGVFILVYFFKSSYKKPINIAYWKYALGFSIPIIGSSLSNIINNQFDRLVINQYLGEAVTGIYSFACNVGLGMQVVVSAIDQAWGPWVYEKMDKKEFADIGLYSKLYRNIIAILFTVFLFITPEIVRIMADKNYQDAVNVIPFILIGYFFFFLYTLELKTAFFFGKTSFITLGTFIACLANITLNFIFIPKYGYIAAAATTTFSYALQFLSYFYITNKIVDKKIYKISFYLTSLCIILAIVLYYIVFKDIFVMRILGLLLICGLIGHSSYKIISVSQ